jgi:ABC-type transport system substrate-binding protein
MLLCGVATLGLVAFAAPSEAATTYGPDNTVTVVDPSPVNWLSVTWNTMEEANRVDMDGKGQPSLATSWKWITPTTIEISLRKGAKYQDGTPFTAANLKTAFDKVNDWSKPHPPGKFLNWAKGSEAKIKDDYTLDIVLPEPDSAAFMKLRGMHVPSNDFWQKLGFIDKKTGSADGHW